MLIDSSLEFCDAVNINGGAGTTNVGEVIDLSQAQLGNSDNLKLVITVETAVTGGTSVQFQLVSDGATTPATNGSQTIHAVTGVFAPADLDGSRKIIVPLPAGLPDAERYLGLQAVRVGTVSAGAINAFITMDAGEWTSYPDAVN